MILSKTWLKAKIPLFKVSKQSFTSPLGFLDKLFWPSLPANDEVDINLVYFNHDKKRLQYKMEMIHKEKKYLASTIEVLALYVDLNERKVAEFEEEKVQIMDDFINKNKSQFSDKDLKFSSKLKKWKLN